MTESITDLMTAWTKSQIVGLAVAVLIGLGSWGLAMSGYINRRLGILLIRLSTFGLVAVLVWAWWPIIADLLAQLLLLLSGIGSWIAKAASEGAWIALAVGLALVVILVLTRAQKSRATKEFTSTSAGLTPSGVGPPPHEPSPSGPSSSRALPQVVLRALNDHGEVKAGDFYRVPYVRVDEEVHSGKSEVVTFEKAVAYLLKAITRVCELVDNFEATPCESRRPLSDDEFTGPWPDALFELEACLAAVVTLDTSGRLDTLPIRHSLSVLWEEIYGEARLEVLQHRRTSLRDWATRNRRLLGLSEQA